MDAVHLQQEDHKADAAEVSIAQVVVLLIQTVAVLVVLSHVQVLAEGIAVDHHAAQAVSLVLAPVEAVAASRKCQSTFLSS
jgi:hypothetical protein